MLIPFFTNPDFLFWPKEKNLEENLENSTTATIISHKQIFEPEKPKIPTLMHLTIIYSN